MIDFSIDTSCDSTVKNREDSLPKRFKAIDEYWKQQLSELLDHGGKKIFIKLISGKTINGVLTGIHRDYVELNKKKKYMFDEISSVMVTNNDKNNQKK